MNTQSSPLESPNPWSINPWLKRLLLLFILFLMIFGAFAFLLLSTSLPTYVVQKVIQYNLKGTGVKLVRLDHVDFGRGSITLVEPEVFVKKDNHRILATGIDVTFTDRDIFWGEVKSIQIRRPHLYINQTPELPDFHVIRKGVRQAYQEMMSLESFQIQDGLLHFGKFPAVTFEGGFIPKSFDQNARFELNLTPATVPVSEGDAAEQTILPSQGTLTLQESGEGMVLKLISDHYKTDAPRMNFELKDLSLKIADPSSLPVDLPIDIPFTLKMKAILKNFKMENGVQLKKPLRIQTIFDPQSGKIDYSFVVSSPTNKTIPLFKLEGDYRQRLDGDDVDATKFSALNLAASNKDTIHGTISSATINLLEWVDLSAALTAVSPGLALSSAKLKLEGTVHGSFDLLNPDSPPFISEIEPQLTVILSNVNASSTLFTIKDLATVVTFNSLFPLSTKMSQSLTFNELALKKVTLSDGKVTYAIAPRGGVTLNSVVFKAFGGDVNCYGFKNYIINDITQGVEFNADVQDLNLASLIDLADVDSFKAEGILSGEGYFGVDQGGLEIYRGSFKNQKPGVINYKAPVQSLEGDAKMALEALDNFKYSALHVDLMGVKDQQSDLNASIHLKGNNPKLLNGYPFEFNIKTTGQLRDVVRSVVNSFIEPSNMADVRKMINKQGGAK